jgi:hypothetical protein
LLGVGTSFGEEGTTVLLLAEIFQGAGQKIGFFSTVSGDFLAGKSAEKINRQTWQDLW